MFTCAPPVCQSVEVLHFNRTPPRPVPRGLDGLDPGPPTIVEVTTIKLDNVMAVFGYSSNCNNASASWAVEAKVVPWDKEVK
jgi:hypothetical protein